MDVFLEQIVAKKKTGVDTLKRVGIVVATVVVVYAVMFLLPGIFPILGMVSILLAAAAIYGAWFLFSSLNVEYEYILTNGEIDVDKIISRRKRKRLITVNARNFTAFGPYRAADHVNETYAATIMACSSPTDPDAYYAVTDHPKFGRCMLIFNPNEKIIENAKMFIKRSVITN